MPMFKLQFDDDGSITSFQAYVPGKSGWNMGGLAEIKTTMKLTRQASAFTQNGNILQPVNDFKWSFGDTLKLQSHHRSGLLKGIENLKKASWDFVFEPGTRNAITYLYYERAGNKSNMSDLMNTNNALGKMVREQIEHSHAIMIGSGSAPSGQLVLEYYLEPTKQFEVSADLVFRGVSSYFDVVDSKSPGAISLSMETGAEAAKILMTLGTVLFG